MDRAGCVRWDGRDVLAPRRAGIALPAGTIYLDGNSLGPLHHDVAARLHEVVEREWGQGLITSWNPRGARPGWIDLPARVAGKLAPWVGADGDELAVADSTSVDLFKALAAACRLRPDRRVILTDDANFPTDLYIATGLAELLGDRQVEVVPTEEVTRHLDTDVAVVTLTHVDYRTGRRHDARALTRAAHEAGALAVWDLSHSTGALAVDLHAWGADLAVGCTYKYLDGGPGSPAFLYVARRWHDEARTPLPGWFGHDHPFAFASDYVPAAGAARFLGGTPPVLSLSALDAALELRSGLDPVDVEIKARTLTALFIDRVDARLGDEVEVITPRDPQARGAQVSLRHPHAGAVMSALIQRGVIGDHRPPDLLRFGFSPLVVRAVDAFDAVEILADVLETRAWDTDEHRAPRPVI